MADPPTTAPDPSARRQRLRAEAASFLACTPPDRRGVLQRLLADGGISTDRTRTWHAVASLLVMTRDAQILLACNKQGWGTTGGHIDPDDASIRAAVAREAAEELGLHIDEDAIEPLTFLADGGEVRPGHAHWDFCYVLVVPEPVPVRPDSDVTDAAWFSLDDLPTVNAHIAVLVAAAARKPQAG